MNAEQLVAMSREMIEMSDNGNIAARETISVLRTARRTAKALATGMSGSMAKRAEREITEAVAMYEAAKTFVTPEWENGKPPYAIWDNEAKTFVVRHY